MTNQNAVPRSSRRAVLTGAAAGLATAAGNLATRPATPALAAASGGTTDWINVATIAGVDPTGANDSSGAIQQAISSMPQSGAVKGGVLYFPAGTYLLQTALKPVTGLRMMGDGRQCSIITNVSTNPSVNPYAGGNSLINASNNNDSSNHLDTVEIDHLGFEATGADLISGCNVAHWYVHDCKFDQESSGNAIWGAPITSSSPGVVYMVECRFERNSEYVIGNPNRSVAAWNLECSGGQYGLNQNVWRDIVCYNSSSGTPTAPVYDYNEHFYRLVGTGGEGLRDNSWHNILFEHCYGGMFRIESGTSTVIDHCWSMDTPETTPNPAIMRSMFYIIKNATSGSATPTCTTIRNSGRIGGPLYTGVADIELDGNCVQTLIEACSAIDNGEKNMTLAFTVNLANSANVCLVALPTGSSLAVSNASSSTYRLGSS